MRHRRERIGFTRYLVEAGDTQSNTYRPRFWGGNSSNTCSRDAVLRLTFSCLHHILSELYSNARNRTVQKAIMRGRKTQTRQGKKLIGYVRVSAFDQADQGVSLAAQNARIEAFAALRGVVLDEVIVGRRGERRDAPTARIRSRARTGVIG